MSTRSDGADATSTSARAPLSPLGSARQRLDAQAPGVPWSLEAGDLGADLDPQDAYLAFEAASWATDLSPVDRRRFERLIAGLLGQIAQGSTRVAIGAAEAALLDRLPQLVGPPGAATPFILSDGWLAPHRLHAAEVRLAAALGQRLRLASTAAPAPFDPAAVAAAVAQVAASSVPAPSEEQQRAVSGALGARLGVITGGPGTGKTSVVLALVRSLVRLGVPPGAIALGAPTGKAANRLGEALRAGLDRLAVVSADAPADAPLLAAPPVPETLHRLLRHSPAARAFAHGEGAPLPFAAVIVDESSMIDLALMDRLVAALGPETQLVLLGDADQLPSVEAGAVFRDLAPLGVRLTQSHRMDPRRPEGRRILALAAAVKAGTRDVAQLCDRRPTAAALRFDGAELCPGSALPDFIARWFDEKLRGLAAVAQLGARTFVLGDDFASRFDPDTTVLFDQVFDHLQRFRLLAVTRARPTGTDAINAFLHARAGGRGPGWVAGEPVMMLRNDYERGLWNGDQGLIVNLREPGPGSRPRPAAVFKIDGRWTPFPLDGLRDTLTLAFALTVHKAQGSEYDEVALVLPSAPHPLLTRDLIYTALTRCRNALVLCGEEAVLASGIGNAIQRSSGLSASLSR